MEIVHRNKILSLQFLRAFACLMVLFTHILEGLNIMFLGRYFLSGQYGVDLFFILSGFLIYITTKDSTNWKAFGIKRVFRIFPLYWFCVIIYFLYEVIIYNKEYSFLYYIQNVLMLPWNGALTTRSLIVNVAWSTVYEVYFYLVFTIILLVKLEKKYILGFLIALFFIFKTTHVFNIAGINQNSTFLFLNSIMGYSHITPFVLGILVGIFFQSSFKVNLLNNAKIVKILFVFIHAIYFYILLMRYDQMYSYLISIVIFVLWLYADLIWNINYNRLVNRILLKIGDISYSIYLLHVVVISIIIQNLKITNLALVTILGYFLVIGISLITYKYIEEPFIKLSQNFIKWKNFEVEKNNLGLLQRRNNL